MWFWLIACFNYVFAQHPDMNNNTDTKMNEMKRMNHNYFFLLFKRLHWYEKNQLSVWNWLFYFSFNFYLQLRIYHKPHIVTTCIQQYEWYAKRKKKKQNKTMMNHKYQNNQVLGNQFHFDFMTCLYRNKFIFREKESRKERKSIDDR